MKLSHLWLLLAATLTFCGCFDKLSELETLDPDKLPNVRVEGALMWQVKQPEGPFFWKMAKRYCDDLNLDGFDDWRMPTIDELRSLIVSCRGRELGGACQVSDPACLDLACYDKAVCAHCPLRGGPAAGCYWAKGMWVGSCTDFFLHWTSSRYEQFSNQYWVVRFSGGGAFDSGVIGFSNATIAGNIRCVRDQ